MNEADDKLTKKLVDEFVDDLIKSAPQKISRPVLYDVTCEAVAKIFINEAFDNKEVHSSVSHVDRKIFVGELAGEIQQTIEDFLLTLREDEDGEIHDAT